MKRVTNFLVKIKAGIDREFLKYTGLFFLLMMILYLYTLFKMGTDMPKFTYAEF